jgi:hypothetical protein
VNKTDNNKIRNLVYTDDFKEFYSSLDERTKDKFACYLVVLRTVYVLSAKMVKKLVTADGLYELRVSVGSNEYRAKLHKVDDLLTERYGKPGTPSRKDFENNALAWYYGKRQGTADREQLSGEVVSNA